MGSGQAFDGVRPTDGVVLRYFKRVRPTVKCEVVGGPRAHELGM